MSMAKGLSRTEGNLEASEQMLDKTSPSSQDTDSAREDRVKASIIPSKYTSVIGVLAVVNIVLLTIAAYKLRTINKANGSCLRYTRSSNLPHSTSIRGEPMFFDDQLEALFTKHLQKLNPNSQGKSLKRVDSESPNKDLAIKPAAHVRGPLSGSQKTGVSSSLSLLRWEKDAEGTFCNPKLSYADGKISISEAGYYYVYSRLLFTKPVMNNSTDAPHCITHFIYRDTPETTETPRKLLENAQTLHPDSVYGGKESNHTSYLGAVFYLYEKDRIMVKVHDTSHLYMESLDSYFGLHLI